MTKGLTFKLWQIKFGSQSYLWVFDGRGVMGLWVAMAFACRGRHWSWVWWVLLATLSSTSRSHWWQLRFLGLIFWLLGLWSNHVVGLQIDFWISEISRIYFFILFYFIFLLLDWFLDACWLWWQSRLVLGCGGGSQFWLWVWWLPVGYICGGCGWRERERERVVFYYIVHIILLGCM